MKFESYHIKKGDTVKVTAGREKGKTGKVLAVYPKRERLLLERLNMIKRHMRPTQQYKRGGIVEKESPIHWSNVMVVCSKCEKPVRVKHKEVGGEKKRICAKCGELLEAV